MADSVSESTVFCEDSCGFHVLRGLDDELQGAAANGGPGGRGAAQRGRAQPWECLRHESRDGFSLGARQVAPGRHRHVATNGDTARLETCATPSRRDVLPTAWMFAPEKRPVWRPGHCPFFDFEFFHPFPLPQAHLRLTSYSCLLWLRGLSVLRFADQARSLTEATWRRLAYGPSAAKVAGTVCRAPRAAHPVPRDRRLARRLTPHLRRLTPHLRLGL